MASRTRTTQQSTESPSTPVETERTEETPASAPGSTAAPRGRAGRRKAADDDASVHTAQSAPESAETPTADQQAAQPETSPKAANRYADESVQAELVERLAKIKAAGFTRPMLMELTGMNGSAIWRAQNGKVHPAEIATVRAVLDKIESGEVPPPSRPDGRTARTGQAVALLATVEDEADLTAVKLLVARALDLLRAS